MSSVTLQYNEIRLKGVLQLQTGSWDGQIHILI